MPNDIIFGSSPDGEMGANRGQYFIIGRVTDVVLGEFFDDGKTRNPSWTSNADLGKIDFEILYTGLNVKRTNKVTKSAFPIFSFIRQYPLIGEIVYIVSGPSDGLNDNFRNQKLFYYPPYSLWNAVNHNAFPNMAQYAELLKTYSQKPGYEGSTDYEQAKLPLGVYFSENENVRTLKPFEGDTILESRFGQSIRFGSSNFYRGDSDTWSTGQANNAVQIGKPITIIVNGQGRPSAKNVDKFSTTVEDVSRDDSSIYLTSGQTLRNLNVADILNKTYTFPFQGNQALICSDRVMLYSKKENVLLYSRKNIGLASVENVTVNSQQTIVTSDKILLGDEFATDSAMKGEIFTIQLVRMLDSLLAAGDKLKSASSSNPGAAAQNVNIAGSIIIESVTTMINFLNNRYHLSEKVMIK